MTMAFWNRNHSESDILANRRLSLRTLRQDSSIACGQYAVTDRVYKLRLPSGCMRPPRGHLS